MNTIVTYFAVVLVIGLSSLQGPVEAQEIIISQKDADYVFSLTRPEWEKQSKKFFAPGWTVRSAKHETGSQIMGFDPSTGIGLSIQPLYQNDRNPPHMVIVGNYFPIGVLPPITDELKKIWKLRLRRISQDYYCLTVSDLPKATNFDVSALCPDIPESMHKDCSTT